MVRHQVILLLVRPLELDLGNRGIRDIIRLSNGNYVIVAGSYDGTSIPAVFRWTGNAADAPLHLPSFDLTGLNAEAAIGVNEGGVWRQTNCKSFAMMATMFSTTTV